MELKIYTYVIGIVILIIGQVSFGGFCRRMFLPVTRHHDGAQISIQPAETQLCSRYGTRRTFYIVRFPVITGRMALQMESMEDGGSFCSLSPTLRHFLCRCQVV